ncbi:hypothetical protein FVEG_05390 [Fusarium verticillioides 7600]|uniref:Steroid 5-alpha reductase C-terminal domain-containing protein n=1 Tax=Gibberella moniliformis (strain M3125 / FGSC 7600) TaxID=334819 RepID=W7LZZ8_GIBM7|nr:hypothetical protein FVEG_05390 [Fusarium verticillioides 7600]EWG44271.1 hypothetical protein FVEG_05390 [Fusarium verticillioides 7600]
MSLPFVKSIEDCGEYAKTVQPYIPELYALPRQILDNIASPDGLRQIYVDTNPLISVWARLAGIPSSRVDLIAAATTLWSCRLTYNYWRKGGYNKGSEDYRWAILQQYVPRFVWFLFNVTFISFYQSVLLFSFSCVPAYAILCSTKFEQDVTSADIVFALIMVGLVYSEWVSDGQQWDYHAAKHQYQAEAKVPKQFKYSQAELDRGFNTSGLWAYSRHPNFAAEQMIWFVLYQWSCFATKNMYSYTFTGAAALILLFQGSTWLTELITAGKYTEYPSYQEQVGMFLPKSLTPYKTPGPKIIRTSDIAKRMENKKQA